MASSTGEVTLTDNMDKDHAQQVAQHYNQLQESGLAERTKSRIFYMRNFNNWIKSMAIGSYLDRLRKDKGSGVRISVLDLCSGKGGDLLKWKKGHVDKVVCADIAGTSVEQCEVRYQEMLDRTKQERRPLKTFAAEFYTADCSKKRLKSMYKDPEAKFQLTSCQFSFHYSFESYDQADMMLRNACECLELGGYFIGTTPNCYELVKRLRASENMMFGNDVYSVSFRTQNKTDIPLYGGMYDFHLEGVVDCPEFVVYFPVLEKMAERYGMKLVQLTPFAEFFEEQIKEGDGRGLIGRMQALEPYPPEENVELVSQNEEDYAHIRGRSMQTNTETNSQQGRQHNPKFGTLSKAEWEAITVYLLFAFQKVADVAPDLCDSDGEQQAADSCDSQPSDGSTEKRSHEDLDEHLSPTKIQKT